MTHTLLIAWDRFNKYEQRAIIKWVIKRYPSLTPGQVPFQKIGVIYDALDSEAALMMNQFGPTMFVAPRRFRNIITSALEQQGKSQCETQKKP